MATPRATDRGPVPGTPEDVLEAWVAAIAQGDDAALRRLYDALSPRVLGICHQILRDSACAEEATIDVFTQVWRQAARFEPLKGSVATWVATLARTRAIDLRRQRMRHSTREAAIEGPEFALFRDPGETPLGNAVAGDRAARVQHALEKLPSEQRRAVEAAFFGGLSHTEIAAAFGQPLGTVKTRIRDGVLRLRAGFAREVPHA
jgi:RNA polymerase sigma-70 factor (ECF subfamily)